MTFPSYPKPSVPPTQGTIRFGASVFGNGPTNSRHVSQSQITRRSHHPNEYVTQTAPRARRPHSTSPLHWHQEQHFILHIFWFREEMYVSKNLELGLGQEVTSLHRDERIVSIMGINCHPLFSHRELGDSVGSSLFLCPLLSDTISTPRLVM